MTDFLNNKISSEPHGNVAYLAKLLRLTPQRIYDLISADILHPETKDDQKITFNLSQAIQEYIEFKSQSKEQVDYSREKALHEQVKRKIAEFELARLEHRMHDAENVKLVFGNMIANARTQFLGFPGKLATQLADRSRDEVASILSREVRSLLLELSDYNPLMFDEISVPDDGSERDK